MESYNSDCENANKDYIKKYDTLISMVNGYDQINDDKSMGTNNNYYYVSFFI